MKQNSLFLDDKESIRQMDILVLNMQKSLDTVKKRGQFLQQHGWRLMGYNHKKRRAYYANLEIEGLGTRTYVHEDAITLTCWDILRRKKLFENRIEFRMDRGRVKVVVLDRFRPTQDALGEAA